MVHPLLSVGFQPGQWTVSVMFTGGLRGHVRLVQGDLHTALNDKYMWRQDVGDTNGQCDMMTTKRTL